MSTMENKPEAKSNSGLRGCAFVVLALLVLFCAAAAYLFRFRLLAAWQALLQPPAAVSGSKVPASHATERKILYWHDPMHPQYRSDMPGKAPDCGMDLVPVYEDGGESNPLSASGSLQISSEKQQLIGVQYGAVSVQPLMRTVRAVARLSYDETRITRVHSKLSGWIERVFVDFTGELVRKGQPLLSIYSPELLATQDEYLLALKARNNLGKSPVRDVAAGAVSLLEAARRRLELWDITDEEISELDRTRKPVRAVTLHATAGGFVIARNAFERQRVMPETELYSIADLSVVWAIADLYEYEVPSIRLGQPAIMTLSSFPGKTFLGKVTYIYPQMDNATRTLKVRLEFPNPSFALKPDMFANVELKIDYGKRLSIPQEAVLDSGSDQIVFVARDGGYFEPRKVTLGDKAGSQVIVLNGLKAGERVVTSGNFLIDSESRLKAAFTAMSVSGANGGSGAVAPAVTPDQPAPTSPQPMDHSQHQRPVMDHSQHLSSSPPAPKKQGSGSHSHNPERPNRD